MSQVARRSSALQLAALAGSCVLLLAACATSPQVQLEQVITRYKSLPTQKAFALAGKANGAWVSAYFSGAPSLEAARERALSGCREKALTSGYAASTDCRVIYENNDFVASAPQAPAPVPAASASESPSPRTNQPPTQAKRPTSSTGSGAFVSATGQVLTAEHVIRDAKTIEVVTRDGSRLPARVLTASRNLDLALLSTSATPRSFFPLRVNSPEAGTRVFTVGYPLPGVLGQEPKVSEGIISSISGLRDEASFMQISVPIQPGNSGGPLITELGELVGVVTSSAAIEPFLKRTGTIPQNVNWAARSSLAVTLAGQEGPRVQFMTRDAAIRAALSASVLVIVTED